MKGICFFLTALFFQSGIWAQVELKEVFVPYRMKVYKNNVFITDEKDGIVKRFDLKTGKLLNKIGVSGEGPGEFKGLPELRISEGRLETNSQTRLMWFDFDGKLLKEQKSDTSIFGRLGNHYVAGKFVKDEKQSTWMKFVVLDPAFNEIKEINRRRVSFVNNRISYFWLLWNIEVHKEKVVVCYSEEFKVKCFDKKGELQWEIDKAEEKRRPFTSEDIADVKRLFKKNNGDSFVKRIGFPDLFPAIYEFKIDGDKLYLFTYKVKDSKNECFIYGTDGNFIKKTWVQLTGFGPETYAKPPVSDINNGILYKMVENEDSENWELHSQKID